MKFAKRSLFLLIAALLLGSLACSTLPFLSSPTATPTATPAPTETPPPLPPTPTPTLPPSPASLPAGVLVPPPPAESGPCANVLYPLVVGNQWIYELTSEGETYQISLTVSQVEGNEATLNTLNIGTGIMTETIVTCDDGAILNFPILMLDFLLGEVDGSLEIEHIDGVFAPSYQTLDAHSWDYAWTGNYAATGLIEIDDEGDVITGRLDESPLVMEWHTLGVGEATLDSVTVIAGEFPEAIKLQRKITIDVDAQIESEGETMALAATLIVETSLWFEPNQGLLKQEVDQASIAVGGISFPIILDGVIELVEFRPAE